MLDPLHTSVAHIFQLIQWRGVYYQLNTLRTFKSKTSSRRLGTQLACEHSMDPLLFSFSYREEVGSEAAECDWETILEVDN